MPRTFGAQSIDQPICLLSLKTYLHRARQFVKFYLAAQTKFQTHSPFVFDLLQETLEDERYFYAFRDVEKMRETMLSSDALLEITDFGAGAGDSNPAENTPTKRTVALRKIARNAGSPAVQGQRLFQLVQHFKPQKMLELGTSVGISTMYMAAAAERDAAFFSLEGCPKCAEIARTNLDILKLSHAQVVTGAFEKTLAPTLEGLRSLDFAYFDGNHRREPTLRYFEACLPFVHEKTVFVFDDAHWSEGMTEAWQAIQQHPRVTLTVDFFDLSLAFFSPDFREKQHLSLVPSRWKPWKVF